MATSPRPSAAAFGPRQKRAARSRVKDTRRVDLGYEPEISIFDDRPRLQNTLTARNWITCPPDVRRTKPERTGLSYADKMAAVSTAWDADRGAGTSRKAKPGVKQAAGYTARTKNPDAKPVKGIAPEVKAAHEVGRMMTWGKAL